MYVLSHVQLHQNESGLSARTSISLNLHLLPPLPREVFDKNHQTSFVSPFSSFWKEHRCRAMQQAEYEDACFSLNLPLV